MVIIKGRGYDKDYIRVGERILEEGIQDTNPRTVYADGNKAFSKRIFSDEIVIKKGQVPLLFSKKVFYKDAVRELLWIWQKRSNDVKVLQDMGCNVWNNWAKEDGTILKAYGYQLNRKVDDTGLNQVDNLIKNLKEDPDSRRHITTLWDISSGHEMALKPCVYETQWVVLGNQLNLKVLSRSTDTTIGGPYNIWQYWVLLHLIANEVGLEVGDMVFSMAIPHIYDRHENEFGKQIIDYYENQDRYDNQEVEVEIDLSKGFYGFTADDIKVKGYKDTIRRNFEIAI